MVAACMQVDVVQPPLDADSSSGVEWSVLISADPELRRRGGTQAPRSWESQWLKQRVPPSRMERWLMSRRGCCRGQNISCESFGGVVFILRNYYQVRANILVDAAIKAVER